jgi:hypothetical protein
MITAGRWSARQVVLGYMYVLRTFDGMLLLEDVKATVVTQCPHMVSANNH